MEEFIFGVGIPPSVTHSGFSQPRSFRPSFPYALFIFLSESVHDDDAAANALFQARHVTEGTSYYYLYVRSDALFLFLFVPALLTRRTFKSFVICSSVLFTALFFSLDFPGVDRR